MQEARGAKRGAAEELAPATPSKRLALLQLAPALAPPKQAAARLPLGQPAHTAPRAPAPAALTVPLTAPCSRVQPSQQQGFVGMPCRSVSAAGGPAHMYSSQEPSAQARDVSPQLPTLSAPLRTWEPPCTGSASPSLTPGGSGGGGSAVLRGLGSNGFTVLVAPQQQRGAPPPPPGSPSAAAPRAVARAGGRAPPACAYAAVGAPPAGARPAQGGRLVTSGDVAAAAAAGALPPALPGTAPGASSPVRVNRRNIVQRLAELGSPPQQQVAPDIPLYEGCPEVGSQPPCRSS